MKKIILKPKNFFSVLATTKRSQVATMVLPPEASTGGPENRHKNSDQWLYILSGKARIIIEKNTIFLQQGQLLLIEAGEAHEVINDNNIPLEMLNIYAPPEY